MQKRENADANVNKPNRHEVNSKLKNQRDTLKSRGLKGK